MGDVKNGLKTPPVNPHVLYCGNVNNPSLSLLQSFFAFTEWKNYFIASLAPNCKNTYVPMSINGFYVLLLKANGTLHSLKDS